MQVSARPSEAALVGRRPAPVLDPAEASPAARRAGAEELFSEAADAVEVVRRLFGDPVARRAALVVAQNEEVARRFGFARQVVVEPNAALDAVPSSTTSRLGMSPACEPWPTPPGL